MSNEKMKVEREIYLITSALERKFDKIQKCYGKESKELR